VRSGESGFEQVPETPELRYDAVAIALHWLVAAALLVAFPLGLYAADLPVSPRKLELVSYHKWIGVTVFALMSVRLAWRLAHRPPSLPPMPAWQRRCAIATHWTAYVLLLAIPASGWLHSSAAGVPTVYLGLWQLPDLVGRDEALGAALKLVHQSLNFALLALVAVHVAAALKHHFVDRDRLLARMLPRHAYFGSSGSAGSERR
jgi:cytochrome b561